MAQTFDWTIIGAHTDVSSIESKTPSNRSILRPSIEVGNLSNNYLVRSVAVLLIFTLSLPMAFGQTAGKPDFKAIERAKKGVAKVGVGEKARVTVRLHDKTAVKGYVSQAGADNFIVTEGRNGTEHVISYTEVSRVDRPKTWGISMKELIVMGIVFGGLLILYAVKGNPFDR